MTKRFKLEKYLYIVLSIILLISIIPLIYISIYSRACADDFNYSINLYHYISGGNWNIFRLIKKAIEVDISFYNNWQGLYTSAFILALQPAIFGSKFYFIGAILLLAIAFFSILYFIKTISKILKINNHYLFLSILIFVFMFQRLPNLVEGLYWFNGAWNYMPFFFLSLINITLCLKYLFVKDSKKYIILSCLLSFVISGGNHVTSFMNILLLIVIGGCSIYKKKKIVCLPFIFAVFGFILMYIAPGTAIRQSRFNNPTILNTIIQTFIRSFGFTSQYFSRGCVLYLFAIILFSVFSYTKEDFKSSYFKYSPIIYLFIAWVILCGMLAVPYYAMGGFGADRVSDVIWLFEVFALTMIAIYSTWYILYKYYEIKDINNDLFVNLLFISFVLVSTCWSNCNYIEALKELNSGQAKLFASVYDERENKIINSNVDTLYVNTLPNCNLIKLDDISDDPNNWLNSGFASYYGANVLALDTDWIKVDQVDSYISECDKLFVLTKDKIVVNEESYDFKLNEVINTSLGNLKIVESGEEYRIMLDDECIKSGNIQELDLFDYLLISKEYDTYFSKLIRVY